MNFARVRNAVIARMKPEYVILSGSARIHDLGEETRNQQVYAMVFCYVTGAGVSGIETGMVPITSGTSPCALFVESRDQSIFSEGAREQLM